MTTLSTRVRLLVVETNDFIQLGIKSYLSTHKDWELIAVVKSVAKAVELCDTEAPEIILIDAAIFADDTLQPITVSRLIKLSVPAVRIAYWTERETLDLLAKIIMADPDGYFRKDTDLKDLLISLSQIARGRRLLSSELYLSSVFAHFKAEHEENDLSKILTPRELQVLRLLSRGCSNSEIADTLGIRISTASVHVSHIMTKLEADNRTHAVLRAAELGLAILKGSNLSI